MKKTWINFLGLKTFLIISIGKIFYHILNSLNYYTIHLPLKKEIAAFREKKIDANVINNLICINERLAMQKYLLRPQTSDGLVFQQIIIDKEYLPLIDLVKLHKAQNTIKTIIGGGSNIGLTSLFLKQYYPKAHIISIEPDPFNHTHQIKNINLNNLSDSIILVNKALWENSTDKLSISNNFGDGQFWSKSVVKNHSKQNVIPTVSLSDLIKQYFPTEHLDILKLDIEGSENVLFRSDDFIRTIKEKVRFMSLEIHDELDCRSFITHLLEKNNFEILNVGETTFCHNTAIHK